MALIIGGRPEVITYESLDNFIRFNTVCTYLKKHGYKIVTFSSGSHATNNIDLADTRLSPQLDINEFEYTLLAMTALNPLIHKILMFAHRQRILFIFDRLGKMPQRVAQEKTPVFTFAHILAPHPPFAFGSEGKYPPDEPFWLGDGENYIGPIGTLEEYIAKYRHQLHFISKKTLEAVDQILSSSTNPPIIIQGDHGPKSRRPLKTLDTLSLKETHFILNALYFPGKNVDSIANNLSPVNTFRVLFNLYFQTNLAMKENRYFYNKDVSSFNFTEIFPTSFCPTPEKKLDVQYVHAPTKMDATHFPPLSKYGRDFSQDFIQLYLDRFR